MVDKRDRLIRAASRVIHLNGYAATTLSLVAKDAAVPLGNVYYYFKTKEALAAAVIDDRVGELRALFASAEEEADPVERLRVVVSAFEASAETIVERGCPYGNLSQELDKRDDELAARGREMFSVQLDWFTAQFRRLGARRKAADAAAELLCAIQGACLVGLAFKDAGLFKRRLRDISRKLGN